MRIPRYRNKKLISFYKVSNYTNNCFKYKSSMIFHKTCEEYREKICKCVELCRIFFLSSGYGTKLKVIKLFMR